MAFGINRPSVNHVQSVCADGAKVGVTLTKRISLKNKKLITAGLSLVLTGGIALSGPSSAAATEAGQALVRAAQTDADESASQAQTQTKTLYTIGNIDYENGSGIQKGNYHDSQNLGVWVRGGDTIRVRQTNAAFDWSLTLKARTNDSATERAVTIPANGEWVELTASADFVPFVSSVHRPDGQQPTIEFQTANTQELPIYNIGDNEVDFIDKWNRLDAPYAVYESRRVTFLIPAADKYANNFGTLDELLNYYDAMIDQYNAFSGLTDDETDYVWNRDSGSKFFAKADANGAGAGYYSTVHTAVNSPSIADYLCYGWLANHEFGHGYYVVGGDDQSEIWNNVYGYYYQKTCRNTSTWLNMTEDWRATFEADRAANGYSDDSRFDARLYFWVNMLDKLGPQKTVADSYRMYRYNKYAQDGTGADTTGLSFYANAFTQSSGYNVVPYFKLWGIDVADSVATSHAEAGIYKNVYSLINLTSDYETAAQIAAALGLESPYSLVETEQLTNLSSTWNNAQGGEGEGGEGEGESDSATDAGNGDASTSNGDEYFAQSANYASPAGDSMNPEQGTFNLASGQNIHPQTDSGSETDQGVDATQAFPQGTVTFTLDAAATAALAGKTIRITDGVNTVQTLNVASDATGDTTFTANLPIGVYSVVGDAPESATCVIDNRVGYVVVTQDGAQTYAMSAKDVASELGVSTFADATLEFKGLGDNTYLRATTDTATGKLNLVATGAQPHSYYGSGVYSTISVYRDGDKTDLVYTKDHIGNVGETYATQIDAPVGSRIVVRHDEGGQRMLAYPTADSAAVFSTGAKEYEFEVTERGLRMVVPTEQTTDDVSARYAATLTSYMDALIAKNEFSAFKDNSQLTLEKALITECVDGNASLLTEEQKTTFKQAYAKYYPFEAAQITWNVAQVADQEYTGDAITPQIQVTAGTTLTQGVDYDVVYTNNTQVGYAKARVVGRADTDYEGWASDVVFKITPPQNVVLNAELSDDTFTYDGNYKMPSMSLTWNGRTLTRDVDYRIIYENNLEAGTATARAVGLGSLAGAQASATFTIKPTSVAFDVALDHTDFADMGKAITPGATVTNTSAPSSAASLKLVEGRDYRLEYTDNTSAGTGRVQAIGMGNYEGSAGSATFTIKTLAEQPVANTTEIADFTIQMAGMNDWQFFEATGKISEGTLRMVTSDFAPHVYYGGRYAYIRVYDSAGTMYYSKEHVGTQAAPEDATVPIGIGSVIEIYHDEGTGDGRNRVFYSASGDLSVLRPAAKLAKYEVTELGLKKLEPTDAAQTDADVQRAHFEALCSYMDNLVKVNAEGLLDADALPDEKRTVERALYRSTAEQFAQFSAAYAAYYPFGRAESVVEAGGVAAPLQVADKLQATYNRAREVESVDLAVAQAPLQYFKNGAFDDAAGEYVTRRLDVVVTAASVDAFAGWTSDVDTAAGGTRITAGTAAAFTWTPAAGEPDAAFVAAMASPTQVVGNVNYSYSYIIDDFVSNMTLDGALQAGATLTAVGGQGEFLAGADVVYDWYRLDAADETCEGKAPVAEGVGATYTLTEADAGKFIRVVARDASGKCLWTSSAQTATPATNGNAAPAATNGATATNATATNAAAAATNGDAPAAPQDGDELFARSANSPSPSLSQLATPGTDYFAAQKSSSPGTGANDASAASTAPTFTTFTATSVLELTGEANPFVFTDPTDQTLSTTTDSSIELTPQVSYTGSAELAHKWEVADPTRASLYAALGAPDATVWREIPGATGPTLATDALAAGTYTFRYTASDADGFKATQIFYVTVAQAQTAPDTDTDSGEGEGGAAGGAGSGGGNTNGTLGDVGAAGGSGADTAGGTASGDAGGSAGSAGDDGAGDTTGAADTIAPEGETTSADVASSGATSAEAASAGSTGSQDASSSTASQNTLANTGDAAAAPLAISLGAALLAAIHSARARLKNKSK